MKFGAEFNDRSISKWKNYNIDYNDLKLKIKLATTNKRPIPIPIPDPSLISDPSFHQLANEHEHEHEHEQALITFDKTQKKLLKKLYKSFKQQIGFVSLFVNSKYGELSRRIQTSQTENWHISTKN
ncbi:unnamed protein product [Ambrosiozyma monospora]|uniref:Unnamed protein product n=1 Tax=Ambrosiozyma monospora TaxID=43982 RepID=A0A9W6Z5N1_AMBMO|nr:unnamed protein product [Ambrosiozyma monospora]